MTSIGCVGVGAALPVGYRWAVGPSAVGALLWGLPPAGTPLTPGSLEHLFLVFPLVIAPLGLWLASVLLDERGALALLVYPLARRLQPFAAALVLASFGLPKGALAGALTAGWLIVAVGISLGGARTAAQIAVGNRMRLNMVAAHVFLPIGAVWLLLSRLGIAPRGLSAQTVLLATLHFHFSGFALQILIVATGRVLDGASAYARLHRMVAVLAVLGIPLIAAGNLAHAPQAGGRRVHGMQHARVGGGFAARGRQGTQRGSWRAAACERHLRRALDASCRHLRGHRGHRARPAEHLDDAGRPRFAECVRLHVAWTDRVPVHELEQANRRQTLSDSTRLCRRARSALACRLVAHGAMTSRSRFGMDD